MTRIRILAAASVAAALASGVSAATATPAAAHLTASCPGWTSSAQACTDCCWNNYGGVGFWDPQSRYCNCAL